MTDSRARLLIISFSDISNDARVRKQINLFAENYRVTTCGRGDAIREDVEHIRVDLVESKAVSVAQAILLRLRMYKLAFALEPEVRAARKALRGRRFDVAIANDAESIVLAGEFAGYPHAHADLHEYWPGLHDQIENWVRLRQPYYRWMMRSFAAKAGSATTVSGAIADRYLQEFGIECGVVHNATPKHELAPSQIEWPLRIVHSGSTQPNRKPEVMMHAVAQTKSDVRFDMYLTGAHTEYWEELSALAGQLGDRIRVLPPKPYSELVATLNDYDIGIHILPATNTNNRLALPNKLFDYVQARLGVIVGPTPDMRSRVEEFGLGAVTSGFDVQDVVDVLDELAIEDVRSWKLHAADAAQVLNVEHELPVWEASIAALTRVKRD